MRYGIFSDVHGNLQALEFVLFALKQERAESHLCVGDVVGYGANPHECIDLLKNLPSVCVAGNHDWAVVDKINIDYFNPLAKAAILWTKENASREDMAFLGCLNLIYKTTEFVLVHGTLEEPAYFHYLLDVRQAAGMFKLMDVPLCFVGHSHIPDIFINRGGRVERSPSLEISLEENCQYIVNVGSVGQPRDGNPQASFCVYDSTEKTISIKRVDYDIEEAQRRIVAAGLSVFLASRLAVGR